jgi:uncharacterized protein (DUF1499 family)
MNTKQWQLIPAALFLFSLLSACAGQPPKSLLSDPKQLSLCPSKPNCVSSYDDKQGNHFIAPIQSNLSIKEKHLKLTELISKEDNTAITASSSTYIRAQYSSSFWGFVDDVEFILEDSQIQMRSASRLGYSDFGVNRKRLESIRTQFTAP